VGGLAWDVIGPGIGALLGLSAAAICLLTVLVTVVEAIVLRLMRWSTFRRSLMASFVMNAASAIIGVLLVSTVLMGGSTAWVFMAFALSMLVEGGVLTLINRGETRRNWQAALTANLVTYLPLGTLFVASFPGSL
jgi:hypothetical protein